MNIEIWMEGYRATGESGAAQKIGEYQAESFDEAVEKYLIDHPDTGSGPRRYTKNQFTTEEHYINRRAEWNIWGCALFNNETDARKSFG